MNSALVIIALTVLGVLVLGLCAQRGIKMSLEQWSVGGRAFSSVLVFFLMAGELYTTFTFLGASGFAYGHGGAALYIITYTCLAFVLSYWLLPPIWRYAKREGVLTQSDFFAKVYSSPTLGLLVAVVGLVALVPYLILQLKGLGIIVELTSYGSISTAAAVWVGAAVMTLYVTVSGMHGSASIAIVKDVVVLAVCVFLGLYLPWHYYGGLGEMFVRIEEARPGFMSLREAGYGPAWFISTVMLSCLGMYLWPHAFNVTYTARSEDSFRKNAVVMPLYALVMLFAMFAGYAAVLQIPGLSGGQIDLALLKLSIATFDPWFVGVIGAAGLLTAIVPGSIMLISASMLISRNLYLPLRPGSSDAHLSWVSRLATLGVTAVALWFTLGGSRSIVSLLLLGFSLVTQLGPALFAAVWRPGLSNKYGAGLGIVAGVAFVVLATLQVSSMKTIFPSAPGWVQEVNLGVVALALNVAVMVVVSVTTRSKASSGTVNGARVAAEA